MLSCAVINALLSVLHSDVARWPGAGAERRHAAGKHRQEHGPVGRFGAEEWHQPLPTIRLVAEACWRPGDGHADLLRRLGLRRVGLTGGRLGLWRKGDVLDGVKQSIIWYGSGGLAGLVRVHCWDFWDDDGIGSGAGVCWEGRGHIVSHGLYVDVDLRAKALGEKQYNNDVSPFSPRPFPRPGINHSNH